MLANVGNVQKCLFAIIVVQSNRIKQINRVWIDKVPYNSFPSSTLPDAFAHEPHQSLYLALALTKVQRHNGDSVHPIKHFKVLLTVRVRFFTLDYIILVVGLGFLIGGFVRIISHLDGDAFSFLAETGGVACFYKVTSFGFCLWSS